MTTPPHQPGPYGQPNQDPYGQQSGGGYGQYGQQRQPQQPQQPQYGGGQQYGGQGAFGNSTDQTQQFGGQSPYGSQYPGTQQWPGSSYGGLQPPEPPKKKTGMIVAIVAAVVLVLGGAGVGIYLAMKDDGTNTASDTSTTAPTGTGSPEETTEETTTEETTTESGGDAIDAQPGDCIQVNVASSTNADVETVDCSDPAAVYKVATREETDTGECPNDSYVTYTEEGQLLLCLQLNVKEGECLEVTDIDDKRADCAAANATHKVLAVLDGVDDETQCPAETTEPVTYPEPALTVCLVSPIS